jgi:hypothetical protein
MDCIVLVGALRPKSDGDGRREVFGTVGTKPANDGTGGKGRVAYHDVPMVVAIDLSHGVSQ